MTSIPDWLVERIALDEVPAASRERADRADKGELSARIAAVKAENAAELAAYPAGPAVAQIEARVAAAKKRRAVRRLGVLGAASTAAVAVALLVSTRPAPTEHGTHVKDDEITRVKGSARLLAFRNVGDHAERLDEDALVRAGDRIQLSYNAGGQGFGVIASVDGAGVVTLHHPVSEDAPPEATALAKKTTALPNAYALDDAPSFERFFFITSDAPIDVKQSLATLRELAHRADSATATLELPPGLRQQSLRLRKPANQKAPTP